MKRIFKLLWAGALGLACFWLGAKALGYVAPFVFSYAAAAVQEPAVSALERRGLRRSMGAGLLTAMLLTAAAGLLMVCAAAGLQTVNVYAGRSGALLERLSTAMGQAREELYVLLKAAPAQLRQPLVSAADAVSGELSRLPLHLSQKILDGMSLFAKQTPDWALFFCTAVIGIYFFSAYFTEIRSFFRQQLSEAALQKWELIRTVLGSTVFGYLKIQCILSGITFLLLLAAFSWMGIQEKFLAAVAVAVVDALPILGAGIVLLPWAVVSFAAGNLGRGIGLLLLYGVLLVQHNVLQAKLMGRHLGLHPVAALVSLYVGWQLAGLGGMLVLPAACALLCTLNNAGIIHLYQ